MSSHDLITESPACDLDPVATALEGCRNLDRLPTLEELIEGMVAGLAGLPGSAGAATLVSGNAVGITRDNRNRGGTRCALRSHGSSEVGWVKVAGTWEKKVWSLVEGESGSLPKEGSEFLADGGADGPADLPAGPWLVHRVDVQGEPLLALLMILEQGATADQHRECTGQLDKMVMVMEPVLSVWAEATVLRTRLRQVTAETRALVRINQLQGRFVAMASHEFKTPLTSITAYADVLLGRVTDEHFPQATEFLGVIKQEADRLLRMINRILDFSRLEFGSRLLNLKLLDLEPLVRETVRSLMPGINGKHQQVTISAPRNLPRVRIDADLIRQVLVNLVGNAVKYTPDGGSIELDLSEQAAMVAVAVRDNGPGIRPEDMKRIFNEFYRASSGQEGTGLGLSIARHIVNLHGGHITVGPRPTRGTEFTFLLPKAAALLGSVPAYLVRHGESDQLEALVTNLLRLLAELTDSPVAVMILRDGQGRLAPVCALGLDPLMQDPDPWPETPAWSAALESSGPVTDGPRLAGLTGNLSWLPSTGRQETPRLLMSVGRHGKSLGCVILGRRPGQEPYGLSDRDQAAVLGRITAAALSNLEDGPGKILSAVRALAQVKRWGIPTATAESLGLVRDLATALGQTEDQIRMVQCAAALHDAGMTRLEEDILKEDGPLAWDQKDEVDRHVAHGLDLVAPLVWKPQVATIIRHHHEWFDGNGHPDGLRGEAIPLGSRVLAVVDAWYSMTTDRPYRSGMTFEEALGEIEAHAGTQFDPAVVSALKDRLRGPETVQASSDGKAPHKQE